MDKISNVLLPFICCAVPFTIIWFLTVNRMRLGESNYETRVVHCDDEAVMYYAGIANGQAHGYSLWVNDEVHISDASIKDWDTNNHATWLVDNPGNLRVIDERSEEYKQDGRRTSNQKKVPAYQFWRQQ